MILDPTFRPIKHDLSYSQLAMLLDFPSSLIGFFHLKHAIKLLQTAE